MTISNDSEFKSALGKLSGPKQRQVAALFAGNVLALSMDDRMKSVIDTAKRTEISDDELDIALNLARKASVDSYTQCGKECDWNSQAGHFVAEAALACLKPGENPAWEAAMHARMARTCESIASGKGTDNAEAAAQYRMLDEYMKD
jgi:hypothetical protein